MATPDYFDAPVRWPHSDANTVIVTGEFDSWAGKQQLSRTANGFEGSIKIPWARKTPYKYIIDGRWTTTDHQPTEFDSIGNLNNVYYAPARPAAPKVQPPPTPKPAQSSQSTNGIGGINGILTNAKNAAVAMVEALAPGTTETPQPTPAIGTDSVKEEVLSKVPTTQAAEPAPETPKESADIAEPITAPVTEPEPAPMEESVPIPKDEIKAEAVLPASSETASAVPVPVLALTEDSATPKKAPEAEVVPGAAISDEKPQPSTHTPADAAAPAVQPSTHTPAANGSVPSATEAPASPSPASDSAHDGPSTHSPIILPTRRSDVVSPPPITNGVNGTHVEKAAEVSPPVPATSEPPATPTTPKPNDTPSEAPAPPTTPKLNHTPTNVSSATSSPANSPRKEKKGSFPTFGRHHRHSSATSLSTNSSTPNELGVLDSASHKGSTKKKRHSSLFGKVKHLFTDEHKKERKA